MKTVHQYRVQFTSADGQAVSTRWYESTAELEKWMDKPDAKVIERDYIGRSLGEFEAQRMASHILDSMGIGASVTSKSGALVITVKTIHSAQAVMRKIRTKCNATLRTIDGGRTWEITLESMPGLLAHHIAGFRKMVG